jgi:Amt family ammonium transporter
MYYCARAERNTRMLRDQNANIQTSVTENLNQWYSSGDQAYILVASAMVLIMIPGLAFLYSGLARRKSALSLIWACMFSASVITFQWYFWGYSLAFGPSTNGFIGNLDKFGLKGVLGAPSQGSPLIPELLYSFYQVWHMLPHLILTR